jgi:hypothetical protein
MANNSSEFLEEWVRENVHATVFNDTSTAAELAMSCMNDADAAGINRESLIKAAGGDVARFMLDRLNAVVNAEVDRLVSRDKS